MRCKRINDSKKVRGKPRGRELEQWIPKSVPGPEHHLETSYWFGNAGVGLNILLTSFEGDSKH